jgi:O-antigen ligase
MNFNEIHKHTLAGALSGAVAFLPFSISLCHFFILLFVVSSLAQKKLWAKIKAATRSAIVLMYFAFFFLHIFGILYTGDKTNGWFDIEKKTFLFILPFFFSIIPFLEKQQVKFIFKTFIAACFVGTFICLFYGLRNVLETPGELSLNSIIRTDFYADSFSNKWKFITYGHLASGIEINPTYFSLYLVFCLLLIWNLIKTKTVSFSSLRSVGLILGWVYLNVFIVFLSSRIMIIALVGVNLFVLFSLTSGSVTKKVLLSTCLLVAFAACIFINPITRYRSSELFSSVNSFSLEGVQSQSVFIRTSLWWQGILSYRHSNPIWGAGTGDVETVMKEVGEQNQISNVLGSFNPHNQFLYTLIGLGVLGLSVLLGCLLIPLVRALRQRDQLYIGFCSIFLLLCFTESALEFQKGISFFTLFNLLLVFHYRDNATRALMKELT